MSNIRQIVVITGMSGSGKSTVLKALEDKGYFCVDNLPVVMLPKFAELFYQSYGDITKLAIVMDLREREFVNQYSAIFQKMEEIGYNIYILFLDAETSVLIRRYSETRRKHPLVEDGSLRDGIEEERIRLSGLKEISDMVIDTSFLNVHQLKGKIIEEFSSLENLKKMSIQLISFGFKYGMPLESDLVFDVRFLPNPYFSEELKLLTGNDQRVIDYIFSESISKEFLNKLIDMFDFLIPQYEKEGKNYLTIAIGCTGGVHRSVAVTNKIAEFLSKKLYKLRVIHRDIHKWPYTS